MNCSATQLLATLTRSARTAAHGKAGAAAFDPQSADSGASGTAPAQPFSVVLGALSARANVRPSVADAVADPKARKPGRSSGGTNATATSGAPESGAQDLTGPAATAPEATNSPAPDAAPQAPQGAASASTATENPASGIAPSAPPAGKEQSSPALPATAADAAAAAQAVAANLPSPAAQNVSDNATAPASTAPAAQGPADNAVAPALPASSGNAAPRSGSGDFPAAAVLQAASAAARTIPSAQNAQPAEAQQVPPPQSDSSIQVQQAGGTPAASQATADVTAAGLTVANLSAEASARADVASAAPNYTRAESQTRYSTGGAPVSQSVSAEAPASTATAGSTPSDPTDRPPLSTAPQGADTAVVARPDALPTMEQPQPTTAEPVVSARGDGSVAQPASGGVEEQTNIAQPKAASVQEGIARLLSPKFNADAPVQRTTNADQGQPVAAPGNTTQAALSMTAEPPPATQNAASRPQGTDGTAELAPADGSSGKSEATDSPADNAASKTLAGRASAAGADEVIARVIERSAAPIPERGAAALSSSPWNDAATVLRAPSRERSDAAKAAGVESLALGFSGAVAAHAAERAVPESLASSPAHAAGSLNEAHFLENIVRQARVLTRPDGTSELTLSLQPADLGTVVVRLTLKDDRLQGQLQVDSQSVRENLQSLLPAVKQALAGEGIDLDRLDVGVRGQGGQSAGQDGSAASHARSGGRGGNARSASGRSAGSGAAVGGVSAIGRWSAPVGVMDFVA